MNDMISRAAAIEAIYNSMRYGEGYKAVCARAIERIPAVDSVPVVRCRDCRYWETPFDKNDTGLMVAHCEHFDESHAFSEQFYCASGERRDSE